MRFITKVFLVLRVKDAIAATYPVTDASQTRCYDGSGTQISCSEYPKLQDGGYSGLAQSFCDHDDGTVTDMATGLMWTKNLYGKMGITQAHQDFSFAGYSDWRLPNMKELYTLIQFDGYTGRSESENIPYINDVFETLYGTDRFIDGQIWSSNEYVDSVMNGSRCNFGLNAIDGRIKCYGTGVDRAEEKELYVRYVRGSTAIGVNSFTVNVDNTIVTDEATGLQWMREDSGFYGAGSSGDGTVDWVEALVFCDVLTLGGFSDWRLPDAHALQSIVDYSRSPSTTNSPAIDPIFGSSSVINEAGQDDFGWYWTSDTHDGLTTGKMAVYVAFGRATGNMTRGDSDPQVMDVHGAGAQRSDPKVGPNEHPEGFGPQGDMRRIYNFARCVRGHSSASTETETPTELETTESPMETPTPTEEATTEAPVEIPTNKRPKKKQRRRPGGLRQRNLRGL